MIHKFKKGHTFKVKRLNRICSDYWGLEARVIGHERSFKGYRDSDGNPFKVKVADVNRVAFNGKDWEEANKRRGAVGLTKTLTLEDSLI